MNNIYVKYRETTRIGNIMFPIACAKQLADKRKCDFFLFVRNPKKKINPESDLTIEEYVSLFKDNVCKHIKIVSSLPKNCYVYEQQKHTKNFSYIDIQLPENRNCVLSGSFESEKFFNTVDVNELFPLDNKTKKSILQKYNHILSLDNITAINVRRGDFLKFKDAHPICSKEYYFNAINYLGKSFPYLIISDDMEWCKNTFIGDNFYFVESTDPVENLYTMAMCKNAIISNSTYSWWGAYLIKNKDKKVIAPANWFGPKSQSYTENFLDNDRYCDNWIIIDEYNNVYDPHRYTCDKIKNVKDNDVIVSFTSWKKRLPYISTFFKNLQKQTIQPTKYILWLSSDEIDKNDPIVKELETFKKLEIHWVDKNLMSFKKFLSIKQYPNAFNIILDDDRLYNKDTIKLLLEESKKYNDKRIISYYTDICNSKGEPWGENEKDLTDYYWINHSCAIYPPNTFPEKVFSYFSMLMINEKIISDECFIMPFLIKEHKYPIFISSPGQKGLNMLNKISPMINETQGDIALHKQFIKLSKSNKTQDNKKNSFLRKVISKLPSVYYDEYKKCFVNFELNNETDNDIINYICNGSTLKREISLHERYIISLTSWKKRINNIDIVLNSILQGWEQPDLIVLNLSSDEFTNKEKDLPENILSLLEKTNILKINWVKHNTKAWKKIIPTMLLYPNDCIVSIDDDFVYPSDFLKTFKTIHLQFPNHPLSGNLAFLPGRCKAHCGCATLTKLEFYGNWLYELTEEMFNSEADDLFYTYAAFCNKCYYLYVGKTYFKNMITINEVNSLTLAIGKSPVKIWNDIYFKLIHKVDEKTIPGNNYVSSNNIKLDKELIYNESQKVFKSKCYISEKKPKQTKDNTTIKIINKPTIVKTLETYKLPTKSIVR